MLAGFACMLLRTTTLLFRETARPLLGLALKFLGAAVLLLCHLLRPLSRLALELFRTAMLLLRHLLRSLSRLAMLLLRVLLRLLHFLFRGLHKAAGNLCTQGCRRLLHGCCDIATQITTELRHFIPKFGHLTAKLVPAPVPARGGAAAASWHIVSLQCEIVTHSEMQLRRALAINQIDLITG
jgi:hypothetical protein